MPAIIVCDACGASPEDYDSLDAETGILPDHCCAECGETEAWVIKDADWDELEGFDDCDGDGDCDDGHDWNDGVCDHCGKERWDD